MEKPWWMPFLREQQDVQFAGFAGTEGSLIIPVDDRLLTRVIVSRLPSPAPITGLDVRAMAGNQLTIGFRLTRPSFLPAFTIRVAIHRQPILPSSPELVFRVVSEKLAALAGTAMRFLGPLPPGLRLEGDLLHVNLATVLERYGAGDVLAYLTGLEVSTTDGRVVFAASAAIPAAAPRT
jgi:hypothetical protein